MTFALPQNVLPQREGPPERSASRRYVAIRAIRFRVAAKRRLRSTLRAGDCRDGFNCALDICGSCGPTDAETHCSAARRRSERSVHARGAVQSGTALHAKRAFERGGEVLRIIAL